MMSFGSRLVSRILEFLDRHFYGLLRLLLDPTRPVEDLNRDDIFSLGLEFSAAHVELEKTVAHIATLKAFLGR